MNDYGDEVRADADDTDLPITSPTGLTASILSSTQSGWPLLTLLMLDSFSADRSSTLP